LALPCARALLSHVYRYGTPMTIRSDRGTQFVNGIISQLLCLLQTDHELSLAYSKEQNAIVERANKEVIRHLTAIILDRRISEVWYSEYLPLVQRITNAKVHDTIGVSPTSWYLDKL
jgi:transposase InsO family protein